MNIRNSWATIVCFFALGQYSIIRPQQHRDPALPSCGVGSVKDGNPGTGPSVINIKFQSGCVIPWHWHTPNERVVIVSGTARAEMKGMEPVMLKHGDFILLSAKRIHQFTAVTPVEIYDFSARKRGQPSSGRPFPATVTRIRTSFLGISTPLTPKHLSFSTPAPV